MRKEIKTDEIESIMSQEKKRSKSQFKLVPSSLQNFYKNRSTYQLLAYFFIYVSFKTNKTKNCKLVDFGNYKKYKNKDNYGLKQYNNSNLIENKDDNIHKQKRTKKHV